MSHGLRYVLTDVRARFSSSSSVMDDHAVRAAIIWSCRWRARSCRFRTARFISEMIPRARVPREFATSIPADRFPPPFGSQRRISRCTDAVDVRADAHTPRVWPIEGTEALEHRACGAPKRCVGALAQPDQCAHPPNVDPCEPVVAAEPRAGQRSGPRRDHASLGREQLRLREIVRLHAAVDHHLPPARSGGATSTGSASYRSSPRRCRSRARPSSIQRACRDRGPPPRTGGSAPCCHIPGA